jgi:hypothetical protein
MGERFYLQQKQGARNMSKNYTDEQVAQMIKMYDEGTSDDERKEVVIYLAREMGKTVGSIRAKLVAVGHYIRLSKPTKKAEPVVPKTELVDEISSCIGIQLHSLKNATKVDLERRLKFLESA